MPTSGTMGGTGTPRKSLALLFALGLSACAALVYGLVWVLLKGSTGCGPARYSAAGHIFGAAPFVIPVLAVAVLLFIAAQLRWPRATVWAAVLTAVASGAALALLVF